MNMYMSYVAAISSCKGSSSLRLKGLDILKSQPFFASEILAQLSEKARRLNTCSYGDGRAHQQGTDEKSCLLCGGYPRHPFQLSCTHMFCWPCLAESHAHTKPQCPTCHAEQRLARELGADQSLLDRLTRWHLPTVTHLPTVPEEESPSPEAFGAPKVHRRHSTGALIATCSGYLMLRPRANSTSYANSIRAPMQASDLTTVKEARPPFTPQAKAIVDAEDGDKRLLSTPAGTPTGTPGDEARSEKMDRRTYEIPKFTIDDCSSDSDDDNGHSDCTKGETGIQCQDQKCQLANGDEDGVSDVEECSSAQQRRREVEAYQRAKRPEAEVLRLLAFRDLLDTAERGCFVALDIDDTIHTNKHHPCYLVTEQGVRTYQTMIESADSERYSIAHRNACTHVLQEALHEKKLVEGKATADTIKELQDRGCWVLGLTSRYTDVAAATSSRLRKEFGIDFTRRSPFPPAGRERGRMLRDPQTGAVCMEGIIFTNAIDKGYVLNRFLEQVVFRAYLPPSYYDNTAFWGIARRLLEEDREESAVISRQTKSSADASTASLLRGHSSSEPHDTATTTTDAPSSSPFPRQLLFVDDRVKNVRSVATGLSVAAFLGIKVQSYLFEAEDVVPYHIEQQDLGSEALAGGPCVPPMEIELVQKQVEHFLSSPDQRILNNHQARYYLNLSTNAAE